MAQPKVHVNDPTYTDIEVAEALDMKVRHLHDIFPHRREYDWPTFAKLVVARKLHNVMPPLFKSERTNTWPAIVAMVLDGPVPRAGRVTIRSDGTIYYIAGTMGSKQPEGISIVWDGMLKV